MRERRRQSQAELIEQVVESRVSWASGRPGHRADVEPQLLAAGLWVLIGRAGHGTGCSRPSSA